MPSLRIGEETLWFTNDDGHVDERAFDEEDVEYLSELNHQFQDAHLRGRLQEGRALGRALSTWLDGDHRWLSRSRAAAVGSYTLEVHAESIDDPFQRVVLEAPWEILTHEGKFLMQHPRHAFEVLRCIAPGSPASALEPGQLALTMLHPSPPDSCWFDFEAEVDEIRDAVADAGIEVHVGADGTLQGIRTICERLGTRLGAQLIHLACHGEADPLASIVVEGLDGWSQLIGAEELTESFGAIANRTLVVLSACSGAAVPNDGSPSFASMLIAAGCPAAIGWAAQVDDETARTFYRGFYGALSAGRGLLDAVHGGRKAIMQHRSRDVDAWHLPRAHTRSPSALPSFELPPRRPRRQWLRGFVGRRKTIDELARVVDGGGPVLIHGVGGSGKSWLLRETLVRLDLAASALVADANHLELVDRFVNEPSGHELMVLENAEVLFASGQLERVLDTAQPLETGKCRGQLIVVSRLDFRRYSPERFAGWRGIQLPELEVRAVNCLLGRVSLRHDLEHATELLQHCGVLGAGNPALLRRVLDAVEANPFAWQDAFAHSPFGYPERVSEWLEEIGIRDAANRLTSDEYRLLRACLTFDAPIPAGVIEQLCTSMDLDTTLPVRLVACGAWSEIEDLILSGQHAYQRVQVFVDALFLAGLEAPDDQEARVYATYVLDALAHAWFGSIGEPPNRVEVLQARHELAQLALLCEASHLLSEHVVAAMAWATRYRPSEDQCALARAAMQIFERDGVDAPLPFLRDLAALHDSSSYPDIRTNALRNAWSRLESNPELMEKHADLVFDIALHMADDAGEHDIALRLFRHCSDVAARRGNMHDHAIARSKVIMLECGRGRYTAARAEIEEHVMPLLREAGDTFAMAMTMNECADMFLAQGQAQAASDLAERAAQLFDQLECVEEWAAARYVQARALIYQGEFELALVRLHQQIEEQDGPDRAHRRALMLAYVVDIHIERGEHERAAHYLETEIIPHFESQRDVSNHAGSRSRLAWTLSERGRLDAAMSELLAVLALEADDGDRRHVALTWGSIANIEYKRGHIEEALRIHETLELPIYVEYEDMRSQALTLGEIAAIHEIMGDPEAAQRLRDQQLGLLEKIGAKVEAARVWADIADGWTLRGDFDTAVSIYESRVVPVFERANMSSELADTLIEVARAHLTLGQTDEALALLEGRLEPLIPECRMETRTSLSLLHANLLCNRGRPVEARSLVESLLPGLRASGHYLLETNVLLELADIMYSQGALREAHQVLCDVIIPRCEAYKYVHECAVAHHSVARILICEGQLHTALEHLRCQVMPRYEQYQDMRAIAMVRLEIAKLQWLRGERSEANIHFAMAESTIETYGDLSTRAGARGFRASIAQFEGRVDDALRLIDEQITMYERVHDRKSVAACHAEIADVLYSAGRHTEAEAVLRNSALPIFAEFGDQRAVASCKTDLAHVLMGLRQHRAARELLEQEVLGILVDRRELALARGAYADTFIGHGNIARALHERIEVQLPLLEPLDDKRASMRACLALVDLLVCADER